MPVTNSLLTCIVFLSVFYFPGSGAPNTYNYFARALQGDLSQAEEALAASKAAKDQEYLAKFRARFIHRSEGLDLQEVEDPMIRRLALTYQDYWRDALLAPSQRQVLEDNLEQKVRQIVSAYHPEFAQTDPEETFNLLSQEIEKRGYRSITGRTPPLLELMLWRTNRDQIENVALVDGAHDIPVTYAEGFISRGWSFFATFGRASTGGWATRDGLFCVAESYDLESENFRISYLKHEGRHYADYQAYPALQSADLEYRAKLTELAFARETMARLLRNFAANRERSAAAPHSLANWHVMKNLEKQLYGENGPPTDTWWDTVASHQVAAAARKLLAASDAALQAAGAETTTGVILP